MVKVAILGYGVVGSGVAEVIRRNRESIAARAGQEISVAHILDVRDFPDSPDRDVLTKDAEKVFGDPEVQIIVETIGGAGIAHEFTRRAFSLKKHVVTSNKELVATHGPELLKMARDFGIHYMFEASVGGGIPIIRPLNQCLAANVIDGITGILNGTTNYILTQMRREGWDFEQALKSAQQNGYAEADPTADIEGHDACRKIAILSSIAYNEFIDYKNIHTEGISGISPIDMEYAEALDSVIKLVAMSRRVGERIFARVSSAMVSRNHPLANVEDVFNAIVVEGDAIGEAMFYGRGAGKFPTASAVVADIIDIVKHAEGGGRSAWERKGTERMVDFRDSQTRYFVRVRAGDPGKVKELVMRTFEGAEFIPLCKPGLEEELAFTTGQAPEGVLADGVEALRNSGFVYEVIRVVRMVE